jgi:hypothetical protein
MRLHEDQPLRPGRRPRPAPALAAIALVLAWPGSGCVGAPSHEFRLDPPRSEDWVDCGTVLQAGEKGAWDAILWGGFASSIVKRGDRYLLYYQGSDDYHETEHTVMHRAIGVATSTDGIHFTKHPGNPVLTYSPRGNHEEGAVSSAPLLDEEGRVVLYYGANIWAGGEWVNADARVAISDDGLSFTDRGVVLHFTDESVWGWGDELFPILAFRHDGRLLLYYIPNGTRETGQLGVAWGEDVETLRTAPARSGHRPVRAWGSGSVVRVDEEVYALFLAYSRGDESYMEVRTVSPSRPDRLSDPLRRYEWDAFAPMTVLFDEEHDRWLLYYRDASHERYGVLAASLATGHGEVDPCARAAVAEP